jgi:hypothetical protein
VERRELAATWVWKNKTPAVNLAVGDGRFGFCCAGMAVARVSRRALQRAAAASCAAAAAGAPNIAGSRAGSWQDPASTDPGRAHSRVRDGILKPLVSHHGRVLIPDTHADLTDVRRRLRGTPDPAAATAA